MTDDKWTTLITITNPQTNTELTLSRVRRFEENITEAVLTVNGENGDFSAIIGPAQIEALIIALQKL